jgi:hypothetical protein
LASIGGMICVAGGAICSWHACRTGGGCGPMMSRRMCPYQGKMPCGPGDSAPSSSPSEAPAGSK